MATRLRLPYEVLSDAGLELTRALHLPTFEVEGTTLLKRHTLVIGRGRIEHVFYPVFPPDQDASRVLFWPLPITTTPPSEMAKRSRSRSWSTPMRASSGTWTFLSTIARRTTAPTPTSTSCITTESSTSAPSRTRTPGASTERRTVPPETITPAQTIESIAWPTLPGASSTNLAGGSGSCQVRIGHRSL